MKCGDCDSPAFADSTHLQNVPYSSSLATLASASSASIWSDASSQHSDDTTITAPYSSASDSCDSYPLSRPRPSLSSSSSSCDSAKLAPPCAKQPPPPHPEVAPELRQNPRRTSTSSISRSCCPPPLVRQCDRKVSFVDNLVGKIFAMT